MPSSLARALILTLVGLSLALAAPSAQQPEEAHAFFAAVAEGSVEQVEAFLRAHPEFVNLPDEEQRFHYLPLHTAAAEGHLETVRLLLEAGAALDAGDSDESTPLHVAALQRRQEVVAFLLERGADVNRRDQHGGYSLSFAASGGDSAIVEMVLAAGADLNYSTPTGATLVHFAASRGLYGLLDRVIARGADINATTENGATPLYWTAMGRDLERVRQVLARGADPNLAADGITPLLRVAWDGNTEMARLLVEHGADVNFDTESRDPALLAASHQGYDEIVRLLLEHGAEVSALDEGGRTALSLAADHGHDRVVTLLLQAGLRPEIPDSSSGRTALHLAAVHGYGAIVRALLDHGARLDARDLAGDTPLQLAARYGHRGVAEQLRARGATGTLPRIAEASLAAQAVPEEGEAVFWYLNHSGWAIKTRHHLLIFDYFQNDSLPDEPGLCNGCIAPAEIDEENVTVFVSHVHGDHYDPETIFPWREVLPEITYLFGFEPEDSTSGYTYIGPRETRTINGMRVTTIESNDSGVGFLVEVDGVTILHPGDHANRQRDGSGTYRAEIEFLAARRVRPDIAFMPIRGCGFGDQVAVAMGVDYTLETLQPRVFLPMHSGGSEDHYEQFVREHQPDHPEIRMEAPHERGDRFRYRNGTLL